MFPLGHLGFKKEKRDSLGPDENLRDRCRQQLLGFCLFCFQAAARKNQSLHHLDETKQLGLGGQRIRQGQSEQSVCEHRSS